LNLIVYKKLYKFEKKCSKIFKEHYNNKGLCGGSASGKTTVAKKIIEELNVQWVSLLSMDSFYKVYQ
jgi:pantothenate kinase-related protein Tda10